MDLGLKGKVALITGGGTGIGQDLRGPGPGRRECRGQLDRRQGRCRLVAAELVEEPM